MSDDYGQDTSTTGSATVGGTATGEIGSSGDRDWFAVDLVAGHTYVIDLRGRPTGDGTLRDPYLRGIHDADGNLISGTTDDDSGEERNSRLTFTASESGTYYIAAGAYSSRQGTYELEVTDTAADDERDGAKDLGDITGLDGPRFPNASLDGDGDRVDYFRFTLTEAKAVGLGLRRQDADADLFLEDAEGNVLYSSTVDGTANEAINETLLAGTYYVRVEAQEAGDNDFKLRYGVSAPDAAAVTALEQQGQGGTNEAPAFAETSYAFDLAENADGGTTRVALGTVSATDPEAATLTYSIEGGNAAGLFEIDGSTGALSYKGSGEDYESGTTGYELSVRASDGSLHSDVTVIINVTDVQEAPAFAETSYAFDLAENADGGTTRVGLGTVSATDPEAAALTYSIEGGNAAGLFEIDGSTGALSYKGSGEDYESGMTSYELTVRANDGSLHSDVTVTVNVTDVGEAPAFAATSYAFDLAENADGSTTRVALGTVSATDPEAAPLTYSIAAGNAAGLFEIDGSTGALSYKGTGEDYESGTTSHELTVRASEGGLHSDVTVTINVTDVEEQAEPEPLISQEQQAAVRETVSEPDGEDLSADTLTTGSVAVGSTATGEIGSSGDRDWFAVDLVAGHTYVIDLRGRPTGDGTLRDPYLRGIHDADGNLISGTTDDDSGEGRNGRLTFTASESGTYYIAAGAYSSRQGTYELEVTDTAADDVRDGAKDLGDITGLDGPRFPNASLDGDGDRVDYFRFTLTEAKEVGLGLRQQDADADLFLEDAEGNVLHSSTVDGTANEAINETLLAGTYYVRVEAQEAGDNDFKLRYGVSAPDAAAVTALEQQGQGGTNEAPAFAETSYAFDLAENADGGTTRVALGTVSATDPEAAALTYSIEGGNAAGLFEIDGSTGALSYRGTGEDYESATTGYELTVRASDGGLHSDVTVTVNVTDVEETVPEPMTSVSEPDGGDLPSDATTTGRVAVGETATGEIGHADDRDWFAVDLVAEHTYDIDLRGIGTYSDSLRLPYLRGIHDAEGNLISDDSRGLVDLTGFSSQLTFTASESGTYYIAAGGFESRQGTYELEVTDTADDDTRDGATDLGDITGWWSPRPTNVFLDGDGDQLDYFRFTLKKMKKVHIAVPLEDADADLYLEDAEGNVLYSSTEGGPANELIGETLQAGTYYVRVQAQEAGDNEFTMSWMAGTPDAWAVLGKPRPQLPEDTLPDDTSTTGRLAVGGTVKGNIESSGDRDWFEVDLVAGQSYVIDLRGRPTGDGTLYDPYLRGVHDAGGNLIADTWQDDGGTGDNSRLTFTASESGTYYIAAGADWGGRGTYELEVTDPDAPDLPENTSTAGRVVVGGSVNNEIEHANDVDWFAVELVAGRAYTIDLRGSPTWFHVNLLEDTVGTSDDHGPLRDPRLRGIYDADGHLISGTTDPDDGGLGSNGRLGEGYTSQLTFTASENGTHYIAAGGQTSGTGAYEVTVWQDDFAATRETTGTIEVVGSAGSTTGEIESAYDRDWFAVELTAGETYKFELLGSHSRGGTVFQPYIHGIHDANGRLVADTTDYSSGPRGDSEVLFTPSQSGTYYVSAGQSQPTYVFAHTGTYTLQVSIDDFSDDSDTAGTVEVGGSVTGEIEAQGDRDWFAVTLEAGKSYEIDMEGSATDGGTLANPLLGGMHDSDGDQIGLTWDHDSGEGLNSRVTFTPDEGGTFYVVAGSGGGQGSADFAGRSLGTYTLSVEEVVDAI